jgi:hypothetical protein
MKLSVNPEKCKPFEMFTIDIESESLKIQSILSYSKISVCSYSVSSLYNLSLNSSKINNNGRISSSNNCSSNNGNLTTILNKSNPDKILRKNIVDEEEWVKNYHESRFVISKTIDYIHTNKIIYFKQSELGISQIEIYYDPREEILRYHIYSSIDSSKTEIAMTISNDEIKIILNKLIQELDRLKIVKTIQEITECIDAY